MTLGIVKAALAKAVLLDFTVPTPDANGNLGVDSSTGITGLYTLFQTIDKWLFGFSALFFVGSMILNSYRLMASSGDPRKRGEAFSGYLWTSVAFVVAVISGWTSGVFYSFGSIVTGGH